MALTATPTVAEVRAAIHTNSLYALDESTTAARNFLEAVNYALVILPKRATKGQEEFEYDSQALYRMRNECAAWLQSRLGLGATDIVYVTRESTGGLP